MAGLKEKIYNNVIYKPWLNYCFKREHITLKRLKLFCLFIGYPRSGHTLLGTIIDAHKNAIVSIESNVLKLFDEGFNRKQITAFIMRRSRFFHQKLNSHWTNYNYQLPDLWQNKTEKLLILGDKKGAGTTKILGEKPHLLHDFEKEISLPLKILHVVRNPFDIITTTTIKRAENSGVDPYSIFNNRIEFFLRDVKTNEDIISQYPEKILTIFHEKLIAEPKKELAKIFQFLELEMDNNFLNVCSDKIHNTAHESRYKLEWTQKQIDYVLNNLREVAFFKHYQF